MIEFVLYTSISCADANNIRIRMENNENISSTTRVELIETLLDSTPHCKWDAND